MSRRVEGRSPVGMFGLDDSCVTVCCVSGGGPVIKFRPHQYPTVPIAVRVKPTNTVMVKIFEDRPLGLGTGRLGRSPDPEDSACGFLERAECGARAD